MKCSSSAFVLDGQSGREVACALIEGGEQKEPFFVFNMDEAYDRIMYFKKKMPRVHIFFAMKSNDHENMLKVAMAAGAGFDCASPGEIHKVLRLGVNPLSIIFAQPCKPPEWMSYARDCGVRHTTFDSSHELHNIKLHWPDAKLLIRIKADGTSVYKLGEKFGCDFETEATALLEEAAALHLEVVGVAFHVGSACSSPGSHVAALRRARALFEQQARAGRRLRLLDIGGGFLSHRADSIDQVALLVNEALDELFPDPSVQVVAEPGRYICESSSVLYCNVYNVRQVRRNNETVNMLYLGEGHFGSLRFNEPWHTVNKFEVTPNFKSRFAAKDECLEKCILWGPSCHSLDRVRPSVDVLLPPCSPNDWLEFSSQGGYSSVFSSSFSCLQKPQTRSVISRDLWMILKHGPVFSSEDFVEQPDLGAPLPSTLPAPPPRKSTYGNEAVTLTI